MLQSKYMPTTTYKHQFDMYTPPKTNITKFTQGIQK